MAEQVSRTVIDMAPMLGVDAASRSNDRRPSSRCGRHVVTQFRHHRRFSAAMDSRAADRGPDQHDHPLRTAPSRRARLRRGRRPARASRGRSRRLDTLVFTDPTGDQAMQGDAAAPAHTTLPPRYAVPARGPIFDLKATGGLPVTWFAARQRHPKQRDAGRRSRRGAYPGSGRTGGRSVLDHAARAGRRRAPAAAVPGPGRGRQRGAAGGDDEVCRHMTEASKIAGSLSFPHVLQLVYTSDWCRPCGPYHRIP